MIRSYWKDHIRLFVWEGTKILIFVPSHTNSLGQKTVSKRKENSTWSEMSEILDLGCNRFSDSYIKLLLIRPESLFHSCGALNKAVKNLPLHQKVKPTVITAGTAGVLVPDSRQPTSSTKTVAWCGCDAGSWFLHAPRGHHFLHMKFLVVRSVYLYL